MLNIPKISQTITCQPLKVVSGHIKLKARTTHPALKALAHFANRLQKLGYPFNSRERIFYNKAIKALGKNKGFMICPNCVEMARFLPIAPKGKLRAWFCGCSYKVKEHHTNGLHRGD